MSNSMALQQCDSRSPFYALPSAPRDAAASVRGLVESSVEMEHATIYPATSSGSSRVSLYPITDYAGGHLHVRWAADDLVGAPTRRLSRRRKTRARSPGLQRILARQPEVIHRAKQMRAILGDPIEGLAQVLQDLPVEDDVWDRIAQEPYG